MHFDTGRIILVRFPFTDHTTGKVRPVLVISTKCNSEYDFTAVPLSSQIKANRQGFIISDQEPYFSDTQLKQSSTVLWYKLMTVNNSIVHKPLGVIPQNIVTRIQADICRMFS